MIRKAVSSFTRPGNTSAYADGDLVANDVDAADVVPLKFEIGPGGGRIVAIRIEKTDAADVVNADFTLRLFDDEPTAGAGDNAAIAHDLAGIVGIIDVGQMVAASDDAYVMIHLGETGFVGGAFVSTQVVYGLLEANAAYGPASGEVFTVALYVDKGPFN